MSEPQSPATDPAGTPAAQQPGGPPPGAPPHYQPGSAAVSAKPGHVHNPPYQTTPLPTAAYPSYPGGQGYQTMPGTPAGPRRAGLIIVVVATALVLVLGVGVIAGVLIMRGIQSTASNQSPPPTPTQRQTFAPSETPTPSDTTVFSDDLRSLLLDRPAAGRPWKDFPSADGNITVGQAVELFDGWDELGVELGQRNFDRGAAAHWTRRNAESVLILLFQFDSAANAEQFAAWVTNGIKGYVPQGAVSQIPGSVLFVSQTPDAEGNAGAILVASKRELVSYVSVWRPAPIDIAGATDLALRQYDQLP